MSIRYSILDPLNGTSSSSSSSMNKRCSEKSAKRSSDEDDNPRSCKRGSEKSAKRSSDEDDNPRSSKRKQTSYPKDKKMQVVYEIIVEHQSKAAMTRKYGVPESTIRGWVKTATAYLDLARQQGRSVDLEPEGFFEDGRLCLDVWKPSGSALASESSSPSIPSASIRSAPTPDPPPASESIWRSGRIGYSDAASSSSTSPSPIPSPSESMMRVSSTVDNNPAPLDMTVRSIASSLGHNNLNEEPINRTQLIDGAIDRAHSALDDLYRYRNSMNDFEIQGLLVFIEFTRQIKNRHSE